MTNTDTSPTRNYCSSDRAKFSSPDWTQKGEARAWVNLNKLTTLWINTGTLCNIECVNCYIESSPTNDRLVYISRAEACTYFEELQDLDLGTQEIGFTGGEPFLNPDMLGMSEDALNAGFHILILTNAMTPMQRPPIKQGLQQLQSRFGDRLSLRVSLDHFTQKLHDTLRGNGSFKKAIAGLNWLSQNGFNISIAGRTCWNESESMSRTGFADLIRRRGWRIDPENTEELVLFPEMDEAVEVPEITTNCWEILGLSPDEMMCASSRMIVKRKGDKKPSVMPCTLLPYDASFRMGSTLAEAQSADGGMFKQGGVKLCHHHCAKFCVLGGGTCSG